MGRNPYNGYKYLCGATPNGVFLMQWYDPLNKFMLLKHFECSIANPPRIFEMIITPDLEYPIVCVNVRRGFDGRSLKLDMINLNSSANWFHSDELDQINDGYATVIPRHELMNVRAVTQLERDTILVCYDSKLHFFQVTFLLEGLFMNVFCLLFTFQSTLFLAILFQYRILANIRRIKIPSKGHF